MSADRRLINNEVLTDASNVAISAFTGDVTSHLIETPALSGFAIHIYGTSATQVDVELSSVRDVEASWTCAQTEASPALPLIIEINETNLPFARLKITGGTAVTARICKVQE